MESEELIRLLENPDNFCLIDDILAELQSRGEEKKKATIPSEHVGD